MNAYNVQRGERNVLTLENPSKYRRISGSSIHKLNEIPSNESIKTSTIRKTQDNTTISARMNVTNDWQWRINIQLSIFQNLVQELSCIPLSSDPSKIHRTQINHTYEQNTMMKLKQLQNILIHLRKELHHQNRCKNLKFGSSVKYPDYHHEMKNEQHIDLHQLAFLTKQVHGILLLQMDVVLNRIFIQPSSYNGDDLDICHKSKQLEDNRRILIGIMECLKELYCPYNKLLLHLDPDEWNETFDSFVRIFIRAYFCTQQYDDLLGIQQVELAFSRIAKIIDFDIYLAIVDQILPHVTATNLSIYTQNNFVLGLVELFCYLNICDFHSSAQNFSRTHSMIAHFIVKLASNTKLTNIVSKAQNAKTVLLNYSLFEMSPSHGINIKNKSNESLECEGLSSAVRDKVSTSQLFRLQCELIVVFRSSTLESCRISNELLKGEETDLNELIRLLLRFVKKESDDRANTGENEEAPIESRIIATDCLVLISQFDDENQIYYRKKAYDYRDSLLRTFIQILFEVKDDYNIISKSINGLNNCLYKTNMSKIESDSATSFFCSPNDLDPKQSISSPKTNNLITHSFQNDPEKIRKMISCLLDVIIFGQQRLSRAAESLQLLPPIIHATKILLEIIRSLMERQTMQHVSSNISHAAACANNLKWNVILLDDLIAICIVVLDIGHRNQQRMGSNVIVELTIRMLCDHLNDLHTGEQRLCQKAYFSSFTEILDVFSKFLLDTFCSETLKLYILETLYSLLSKTTLYDSDDNKNCLVGWNSSWSCIFARQPLLLEAFAKEASLIVENNDSSDSVSTEQIRNACKRRLLAIAILSSIAKNFANQRVLAKHPSVLSSLVRFMKTLEREEDVETPPERNPSSHHIGSHHLVQSTGNFQSDLLVCKDDLKHQIISLASLL